MARARIIRIDDAAQALIVLATQQDIDLVDEVLDRRRSGPLTVPPRLV